MAEVKRTPGGQSFLNRPIGVVNVRTDAEKKYSAEAELFRSIGQIAFDQTISIQEREGQKFAETKLIGRNEDQTIKFEKAPRSLGRYGQEVADKVLEKRYYEALAVDTDIALSELRKQNLSPERFEGLAYEFAEKTAIALDRDGGADVAQRYMDEFDKVVRQNVNSINTDIMKQQEAVYASNQLQLFQKTLSNSRTYRGVDPQKAEESFQMAISIADDLLAERLISPAKHIDLINNNIDGAAKGIIDDISERVSSLDLKIITNAIRTNKFTDEVKKIDPVVNDLVEFIEKNPLTDSRTREISGHASSVAGLKADIERQESAARTRIDILSNDSQFGTGKNKDVDKPMREYMLENFGIESAENYITGNVTPEALAANFKQSRYDPALRAAMDAASVGMIEDPAQLSFLNEIFQQGRIKNGYKRDRGLDSKTIDFFEAFDHQLKNLGASRAEEARLLASSINVRSEEKLKISNDKFGFDAKNLDEAADKFAEKYLDDVSPDIIRDMRPSIVSAMVSSLTGGDASERIKETIKKDYPKSEFIYGAGKTVRSKFAPEKVFADAGIPEALEESFGEEAPFVFSVNRQIFNHGLEGEFGKDFLLQPDRYVSTAAETIWTIVYAKGNRAGDTTNIRISSKIMDHLQKQRAWIEEIKLEKERKKAQGIREVEALLVGGYDVMQDVRNFGNSK